MISDRKFFFFLLSSSRYELVFLVYHCVKPTLYPLQARSCSLLMSLLLETRDCDMGFSEKDEEGDSTPPAPSPSPPPPPCLPLSPHPFLSFPLFSPPPRLSFLSSPALLPLPGLSVELRQQVWQRPRLSRKTRGLKAHKFHAVQHANVPSADKRAFNPAALLLSTLLPRSLLSLYVTLPPSLILSFSYSLFPLLFCFYVYCLALYYINTL